MSGPIRDRIYKYICTYAKEFEKDEKMKKQFLVSLEGKSVAEAKKMCKEQGLDAQVLDHGVATILLAIPKTVIMWKTKNGKMINSAMAGDGAEVE